MNLFTYTGVPSVSCQHQPTPALRLVSEPPPPTDPWPRPPSLAFAFAVIRVNTAVRLSNRFPCNTRLLEPRRGTGFVERVLPGRKGLSCLLCHFLIPLTPRRKHTPPTQTQEGQEAADGYTEGSRAREGRKAAAQDPPGPAEAERRGAGFAKCWCGI